MFPFSGHYRLLYSVDSWSDHHDWEEFLRVKKRLRKFGRRSKVLKADFDEAYHLIPDQSLNFLYVDGYAHTGMNAGVIAEWLPKLADNAVIAGHDYCKFTWPENVEGIDRLMRDRRFRDFTFVPGVITNNDEDAFPSFFARYTSKTETCFSVQTAY